MATNPYVNKVVYGNQTVMDISDTTATAADVADGEVFYTASGQRVTGSYAPTSLTPSNSTPATITSGTDYHATAGGYAVQTIESKVIQNTPIPIDVGRIYQISTESVYVDGYIINSYSSKTPNDSNPPSVSNNEIVRMGSSGYLYKTQQSNAKIKHGSFTDTSSSAKEINVDCGFRPKYIAVYFNGNGGSVSSVKNGSVRCIYDETMSETTQYYAYQGSSGTKYVMMVALSSGSDHISEITSTGFVYKRSSNSTYNGTYTYFACSD